MRKKSAIRFDMEDISDISDSIIEIDDFYTKPTRTTPKNQLTFPIPSQLKADLNLNAGDLVYFCQYSEGFYLSFRIKPEAPTKAQIRSRKLGSTGTHDTLILCIPPFIKNLHREPIAFIKLIHTKGFQPHEWQIQFLSTDCI